VTVGKDQIEIEPTNPKRLTFANVCFALQSVSGNYGITVPIAHNAAQSRHGSV
jgi:hypothetical protein